jgi:hypothetical protein
MAAKIGGYGGMRRWKNSEEVRGNVNNYFKKLQKELAATLRLARMRAPKAQPPQRDWQK